MELKLWLDGSGLSRADLAKRLGIGLPRLAQLLNDPDAWVSRRLAVRLAEVTNGAVTAHDFAVPHMKRGKRSRWAE